nr:sensor domain-containing diguanylate cyclase [Clostridium ganghwense]
MKNSYVWYETQGKIDRTVIVNNVDKFDKIKALDTEKGNKIKSTISAPIFIERQLYGFVNVDSIYNYAFDQTDLEVMEYMRNQIEIAISKHKLYEEIVYLSRFDKLTNVYNRRYFEELFDTCVNKTNELEKKILLVVFDLNELKVINDTYGHLAGDELIKTFASALGKCVRSSDILARIGGDEFVGIFFDVDSQTLVKRFDKLIKKFENNPITFEENNIICSFSYDIANFPQDGNDVNKLIKIADKCMYEYKYMIKNMHKLS